MPENKRIQYIDTAKFLGILLVVFFHGYKENAVTSFVYAFHMPLFFFLNGMTFKPDNISAGDFLIKKIKGYLIPAICLGMICCGLDALFKSLYNMPWDTTYLLSGFSRAISQQRFHTVWFLTALFFSDVFLFWIYHKCRKNIWLTGLGALALLGLGIFYTKFTKTIMAWNIDAALFGTIFTYFGFLFTSKNLSRVVSPLISRRWLSLLVGTALMVATFFVSLYIRNHTFMPNFHMDMFRSNYGNYYLPLSCALLGSIGFVILCRGITNFILAYPVKYNLMLLAIHQVFTFPIFRFAVAKEWWIRVAYSQPNDPDFILFVLAMTGFSLATAVIFYYVIIITPFSFILNKKRYPLFEKIIQRVRK